MCSSRTSVVWTVQAHLQTLQNWLPENINCNLRPAVIGSQQTAFKWMLWRNACWNIQSDFLRGIDVMVVVVVTQSVYMCRSKRKSIVWFSNSLFSVLFQKWRSVVALFGNKAIAVSVSRLSSIDYQQLAYTHAHFDHWTSKFSLTKLKFCKRQLGFQYELSLAVWSWKNQQLIVSAICWRCSQRAGECAFFEQLHPTKMSLSSTDSESGVDSSVGKCSLSSADLRPNRK